VPQHEQGTRNEQGRHEHRTPGDHDQGTQTVRVGVRESEMAQDRHG
jgi:hypothetical protein